MKQNLFILFLCAISIIITSCRDINKPDRSFSKFPKSIKMNNYKVDQFALKKCYDPHFIDIYDSLLILTQPRAKSGIINFYSIKTHKLLFSFGRQGRGPGEFISPGFPTVDKNHGMFWIIDLPKKAFYGFHIEEMLTDKKNIKPAAIVPLELDLMPAYNYIILKDTSILIPSAKDSSLFTIIDKNGKIIKTCGTQPVFDSKGLSGLVYKDLLSRLVVYNKDAGSYIFSYTYYDKLLKYTIKDSLINIVTGPDHLVQHARAADDGRFYRPFNIKEGYFYTLKIHKNRIYALYQGGQYFREDLSLIYPKNVHVFDGNLNPLANLIFDQGIRDFDLNEAGDRMYAITTGSEKNIVVYKLIQH